jgi:ADP-ribose pyrophosphatase YjhB (NUDIX family)
MIPAREVPHVVLILLRCAWSRLGGPPTGGAQCLAVREDGAFLLVKASYRRQWSLPGGFVEPRESAVDAAVRELREETGVALVDPVLAVTDARRFHNDHLVVGRVVAAAAVSAASTAWEIGAARWVTLAEFRALVADVHPHSHRLLRRLPAGLESVAIAQARATT